MPQRRPAVDLKALTSDVAAPMPEASQRMAPPSSLPMAPMPRAAGKTANLEALAFKVPPEFRRRFKRRAADADLKLNELLFAAFEAWEEKQGFTK